MIQLLIMKIYLTIMNQPRPYRFHHIQSYLVLYIMLLKKNEISKFVVCVLFEMKEVINSKNNNNLNLDRLIKHLSKSKNTFTPLGKESRLV